MIIPRTHLGYFFATVVSISAVNVLGLSVAFPLLFWLVIISSDLSNHLRQFFAARFGFRRSNAEPAFAVDPDSETAAWINEIVAAFWHDGVRPFAAEDGKRVLNELIAQKLRSFKMPKCLLPEITWLDLGEHPPWVTSVKSSATDINFINGGHHPSLSLDIGLLLHLRPVVEISLGKIFRAKVTVIKFSAPLRVLMTPLMREATVFGQAHVSLLKTPSVDYQTGGVIAFLSWPFVRPIILSFAATVFEFVTHPRKVVVPNPLVDVFTDHVVTPSRPLGLLRVHLLEGRNMEQSGEFSPCVKKLPSPYAIVRFGPTAVKTTTHVKSGEPKLDHLCEFSISENSMAEEESEVRIEVYDFKCFRRHDPMGYTSISVATAVEMARSDTWFGLVDGIGGEILVRTDFVPVVDSKRTDWSLPMEDNDQRFSQAILSVLVLQVSTSTVCKPMLVLEVSGRPPPHSTSHGHSTSESWEFAEEFFLPVGDVTHDKISISLVSYDDKHSIKAVTQRTWKAFKNFLVEKDSPRTVKEFDRDSHKLLGKRTLSVLNGFTGTRQRLRLPAVDGHGGAYEVLCVGRLHALRN